MKITSAANLEIWFLKIAFYCPRTFLEKSFLSNTYSRKKVLCLNTKPFVTIFPIFQLKILILVHSFELISDSNSVSSADPITNSETTNLDFHDFFDQLEQGLSNLEFRCRSFGISYRIWLDTGLHSDYNTLIRQQK